MFSTPYRVSPQFRKGATVRAGLLLRNSNLSVRSLPGKVWGLQNCWFRSSRPVRCSTQFSLNGGPFILY